MKLSNEIKTLTDVKHTMDSMVRRMEDIQISSNLVVNEIEWEIEKLCKELPSTNVTGLDKESMKVWVKINTLRQALEIVKKHLPVE